MPHSLDSYASSSPARLSWAQANGAVWKLWRVASFQPAVSPVLASSPSVSRNGWGMVPVLNELLDRTAAHRQLLQPTHTRDSEPLTTTSPTSPHPSPRHRKRPRLVCINCRRVFSLCHDAASRPLDGHCSVDCRASHTYMDAIASDTDAKLSPFLKSDTLSTLDCESSWLSPATLRSDDESLAGLPLAPTAIYARP